MTMKDFGALISKLRKERDMSQEELATALNCTKQTVSNYERNTRKPGYETLEAIADIFNVPMGFFLTEEEQQEKLKQIYRSYKTLGNGLKFTGSAARSEIHEFVIDADKNTQSANQQEDDELWELRETMRRDPNMRVLFSTAKKATPKQIKQAIAVLEALKASDESME